MTQLAIDWSTKRASVEALESLKGPGVREDHRRILDALRNGPLSDEQLLDATGVHPNAIRARRQELQKSGRIVACGEPVLSKAGRRVTAWRLP